MDTKKAGIIAAVIVALTGGAAVFMRKPAKPAEPAAVAAPALEAPAPPPTPAEPPPANLPSSLDKSDDYARAAAQRLFSQPVPPPWLQTEGLLRRLTAAAAIVAEGESPRDALAFLRPRAKFKTKKVSGRTFVDPASYARYDAVGDLANSLDAQAAAKFISQSRPLFQQACAELNDRGCDFKDAVIKSAKELLKTPVVNGDIRVKAKVVSWEMVDPKLEGLGKAQKHLLRLGPVNEQKVQNKLRELALALGASDAELPRPTSYTPAQ